VPVSRCNHKKKKISSTQVRIIVFQHHFKARRYSHHKKHSSFPSFLLVDSRSKTPKQSTMLSYQGARAKALFSVFMVWISKAVSSKVLYEMIHSDQEMYTPQQKVRGLSHQNGHRLHFYVMGDAPYLKKERIRFPLQVASLDERPDFLVHVGDMKIRSLDCPEEDYRDMRDMLRAHSRPSFIVLGDNDWFECGDRMGAYNLWHANLGKMESHWPSSEFSVFRQRNRTENFAFVNNHILVMGLHVVHASFQVEPLLYDIVDDSVAFLRSYADWIKSDDIEAVVIFAHAFPHHPKFESFLSLLTEVVTSASDTSFIYLHGDDHIFKVDNPFPSLDNFLQVAVDKGGIADPLEVVVDTSSSHPFKIKRRPLSEF
jgi:hypothetical protein